MRLVIGGPARDSGPVSFAFDLALLYARTREEGPWELVTLDHVPATYVHVGREAFLAGAIDRQATHVLWLDTDMEFPPDAAIRLAQHDKALVACNCVMRNPHRLFTAWRDGRCVETTEQSTGLEAVDTVGMGMMLMRTDVVQRLPRPWFEHGRNDDTGGDIGEDVMFCRKLRKTGRDIYIDHDLSKEIGHIGQHAFRIPSQDRLHA
jgi:hypothetical protein